ncbi:DNA cytosine methyltransferase [Nostoc sp. FACHB-892]|uniref:DNA cytosine methyltransferase n=1 Tax=Nostoc sp. FACHB-892 TaxID=2692843 RepID=UPI00321FD744
MCANFSQAHTAEAGKGGETNDDLTAAIAVAEAIRQLQPRVFTLENVPRYQNSQSFSIILDALELEGYLVTYSVVSMDTFGLPQARRRLVLVASRGFHVALPTGATPCGWYEAIAHLIPTMTDSQLLPKQRQAVEKFLTANEPTPLLLERVGGRNGMKYKPGHLPCNTILRSHRPSHLFRVIRLLGIYLVTPFCDRISQITKAATVVSWLISGCLMVRSSLCLVIETMIDDDLAN